MLPAKSLMRRRMVYSDAFFDLQLRFAHAVAARTGRALADVLLTHTNLYIRFGLGRTFDASHPVWRQYLAGLQSADDALAWTCGFHRSRVEVPPGPPVVATFGCFSYALIAGNRIRLHFKNLDTEGQSSLGVAHAVRRRAELAELFRHARQAYPGLAGVVGISWLYNLDAYRRLLPGVYTATRRPLQDRFQGMPLWGQFLDRFGDVKEHMARLFLARLEQPVDIDNPHRCFPLPVCTVAAPMRAFHEFYDL